MAANTPQLTNVINPNGELVSIDQAALPNAVNYGGYRVPSADELAEFARQEKYGSGLSPLVAGAESAASAMTLGASRQLENASGLTTAEDQAGRAEANPVARGAGAGVGLAAPLLASFVAGPELGASAVAADSAETAGLLGSGAKAAGQALSSSALPLNAVTRAGRAIGDALTPAGADSLGSLGQFLAKAPAHALGSAVEGAAFGLGQSVDEDALGDTDALGEKLLPNMLGGAGIGALIGGGAVGATAAVKGVGQMLPDAKNLGVKLLSTFGGMSEKDITAYMADREAVNAAPEFDDVYQHSLGHVQGLADQVAAKQITADEAREALQAKAAEIKATFSDLGYDARRSKALANDALDRAQEELATKVQSTALDQAPAITEAVESLHSRVVDGSSNAFEVLSQQEGHVPLRGFYQRIGQERELLDSQATLESKAMSERLGQYAENVKAEYGSEVRPAGAKLIIQGLDKVSKYDFNATSFDKGLSGSYKKFRYYLDDKIKEMFPEYRAAMRPVSEDSKLLRSLEDYGTPEDATRRIKSLKTADRYRNEMPLLKELEARTGAKFTGALEPYANPATNRALHEALPEYGAARKASDAYDALQNPRMKRAMQEIEGTPEFAAHRDAQAALEAAQNQQKTLGLSQANLQGKLKGAMGGKNIEAARVVSQLPGMEGKKIPDVLKAIQLKEAFQKGSMNGSRHVNMYGGLVGALGGALTGHFYLGAGAGGAIGGFMDKYGPQVTKRLLDAYANNAIHVGTLTALERAGQKTTRALTSGAKAVFAGPVAAASTTNAIRNDSGDHDEIADGLRSFGSSPDGMVSHLDQVTRAIYHSAPKTAGSVQQSAVRATQFLQSKLPAMPPAKPFSPKLKPSQAEISTFNRYLSAVENPTSVLGAVRDGSITPESIEALSAVYPKLLGEMRSAVLSEMTNHMAKKSEPSIPYATKLGLSIFLGQDLDDSLSQASIASNQMAMSQAGGGQGGAPGGGAPQAARPTQKGLSHLSASAQIQTPLQSLAQRSLA